MQDVHALLQAFVRRSQEILADHLVGIYLHGSAAMGCFHWEKSDLDLLIVVDQELTDDMKRPYMDRMVELNRDAPPKGLEWSIVRREVLKPFVYPTPYELHFSNAHLAWYEADPADYLQKMKGADRDLAAHCTIIFHRGKCLYGEAIPDVFGPVDAAFYLDSILYDVEDAEKDILSNPTYMILNCCRVLAYKRDALILSKQEGGDWGISHLPEKTRELVQQALDDYSSARPMKWDRERLYEFAVYMKEQIRG